MWIVSDHWQTAVGLGMHIRSRIHTLGVHAWPIGLLWPIVVRSNQHKKENLVVHLSPNFTPWEKPRPQNRLASLPSSLSPRATAAGCCPARCPPTASTARGSGSPEHSSSSTPAAKSSGSRVIFHYGGSSTQVSRTPDLPRARPSSTDLARKNHLCSFVCLVDPFSTGVTDLSNASIVPWRRGRIPCQKRWLGSYKWLDQKGCQSLVFPDGWVLFIHEMNLTCLNALPDWLVLCSLCNLLQSIL